jgi:hypothetical protein
MEGFHFLDWTVLGLFGLALIGIIIWVSRMKEDIMQAPVHCQPVTSNQNPETV